LKLIIDTVDSASVFCLWLLETAALAWAFDSHDQTESTFQEKYPMSKAFLVAACGPLVFLQSAVAGPLVHFPTVPVRQQQTIKHDGKIESKYDGLNSETVMRLRKMKVNCSGFKDNFKDGCVSIDVALHLPGTQLNYVRNVTLQIVFETKDWTRRHSPEQRDLAVIVDAETLRLGRMSLVPKGETVMDETMVETLETSLPYDVFKKIALSESVEMQIGGSSVELRDKNRAALRDLNSRVIPRAQ
jgi:hypothetical protein